MLVEGWGEVKRLIGFVQGDGLANVIHDHLAGITADQVLFEGRAYAGGDVAIDVIIQPGQQFIAVHSAV